VRIADPSLVSLRVSESDCLWSCPWEGNFAQFGVAEPGLGCGSLVVQQDGKIVQVEGLFG
jgi:hypothetical protein